MPKRSCFSLPTTARGAGSSPCRNKKGGTVITSFPPIADSRARVLILGTMPGIVSLRKRQYYGHPLNQFWPIIYAVFGEKLESAYSRRTRFLKSKGIALWDTLVSCERAGSADQNIRNEVPVDLAGFLTRHPCIRHIAFDGAQAGVYFKRYFGAPRGIITRILPSTSPRNTVSWDRKLKIWSIVRHWAQLRASKTPSFRRRVCA